MHEETPDCLDHVAAVARAQRTNILAGHDHVVCGTDMVRVGVCGADRRGGGDSNRERDHFVSCAVVWFED